MTDAPDSSGGGMTREQEMSALFANLIMQQSNMAMLLMGKVVNPETGKTLKDLPAAELFIDQLQMIEAKTKGNLSREEESLLQQTLMSVRLTYVETVEDETKAAQAAQSQASEKTSSESAQPSDASEAAPGPATIEDEARKKFTKKY